MHSYIDFGKKMKQIYEKVINEAKRQLSRI